MSKFKQIDKYEALMEQMMEGMSGLKKLMESEEFHKELSSEEFQENDERYGFTYGDFVDMINSQSEYGC